MKYYKIYSNCVRKPKHIIELTKQNAFDLIKDEADNELYYYNIDWNWIHEDQDDDTSDITQECMEAFYDYVVSRLFELFDELSYIDCGDYKIVQIEDDEEPRIQDCCCSSMSMFF